jgi:hypothetical protein
MVLTPLSTLTTRGQLIEPTQTVQLVAVFNDQNGNPVDTDVIPSITIRSPTGLVILGPTSAGVMRNAKGTYSYSYLVGIDGPLGVWTDIWQAVIAGFPVSASFNFVVTTTDMPAINTDGYVHLGDDPGFNYSQTALLNINKLMKTLRRRLNSSGKAKSTDAYGNITYVNCDIFSVDMLATFLGNAISDFNQIPYFTYFTFEDTPIIDQFHDILVEGATLMALASQALIERGREFNITDNGVNFVPPTISELLNTQYSTLLTAYNERLKYIKNSMRPSPTSLGTFRLGANVSFRNLRHRRERQLF